MPSPKDPLHKYSVGIIDPKHVRRFIGEPKYKQWRALLKRCDLLELSKEPNKNGSWLIPRTRFTLEECKRVLERRYAELGERLLRRRGFRF